MIIENCKRIFYPISRSSLLQLARSQASGEREDNFREKQIKIMFFLLLQTPIYYKIEYRCISSYFNGGIWTNSAKHFILTDMFSLLNGGLSNNPRANQVRTWVYFGVSQIASLQLWKVKMASTPPNVRPCLTNQQMMEIQPFATSPALEVTASRPDMCHLFLSNIKFFAKIILCSYKYFCHIKCYAWITKHSRQLRLERLKFGKSPTSSTYKPLPSKVKMRPTPMWRNVELSARFERTFKLSSTTISFFMGHMKLPTLACLRESVFSDVWRDQRPSN